MADPTISMRMAVECFTRGADAAKKGNFDYAIEMYFQCTKHMPEKLNFRQALREAEYKKYANNQKGAAMASIRMAPSHAKLKVAKTRKKWREAIEYAEEALKYNPWDAGTLFELAQACKEEEYLDTAIWALQTATIVDKKTKGIYLLLAELYEQTTHFEQAIKTWEMVQRIDPADHGAAAKVRQLAASSTIKRGNYEDSEKSGDTFRNSARSADVFDESGGAETPEGKLKKEIAQLEAKTATDPSNASIYTQLGHLYRKIEDYDEACKAYQKALDATAGADFDVKAFLMDSQIDKLRKTRNILKDRIDQLDPSAPDAEQEKKLKSQFNAYSGEIVKREVDYYRLKVSTNSQDYASHYELGYRLLQLNMADEAIKSLQQGRNDVGKRSEALYWLGYAFRQKKNYTLADKNFADALLEGGDSNVEFKKKVLYYRARVAEDRKDVLSAVALYNDVAAIDYGYKDVAKRLDQLNAQNP